MPNDVFADCSVHPVAPTELSATADPVSAKVAEVAAAAAASRSLFMQQLKYTQMTAADKLSE